MTVNSQYSYAVLRQAFLDFFQQKGHTVVPSSSLVPANDPTLLFTNAGMVQFKDVFLGLDQRDYSRAATAQRCVRAGGKHNDLENVGYTARHHTFFEMLGNFSFGDYFKREAIHFAWEFLTLVLKLPPEKLWVTVYEKDEEAADIWLKEVKIDPNRFSRCGEKDNFWSMGDTGPCGPCTEIFYDHGPAVAGGPPGSPEADGDRYIEIWNLVFMQFDRNKDGELIPLPKPSVDTGMGIERLAAVLQGVHSNYETDLFVALIQAAAKLANTADLSAISLRVIADHIRSTSFLITDGVIPSNEGRGYVLRRIIRRAVRHGNKLGIKEPFFYKLVSALIEQMGEAYPELAQAQSHIERVLYQEEEQFAKTLEQGLKILETDLVKLTARLIPGTTVFKLYDTYGFPIDLTADIARERGLEIDYPGFEEEMAKQRRLSQESGKFNVAYQGRLPTATDSCFLGYENVVIPNACITEIFQDGQACESIKAGEHGAIVLDNTPFYAESGGQVGDKGILLDGNNVFEVEDTQKEGNAYVHYGVVKVGAFRLKHNVQARVDIELRQATARNHTSTHLLHAALRKVLGAHVLQKGSLVNPDRLRFDFAHYEALTMEQLITLERLVNQQIRANFAVVTEVMPPEAAMQKGAIGLFGEKYGSEVRVLSITDFSMELCGGTHVQRTGDIGFFKIISEAGIAAGVRRLEAITGEAAEQWVTNLNCQMQDVANLLKASLDNTTVKLAQLLDKNRFLEKSVEQLQARLASSAGNELISKAKDLNDIKVLAEQLPNADAKTLRDTVDQIRNKLGKAIVVLSSVTDGRVNLVVGVSKECTDRVKAGELANYVAEQVGGKGGGRPDMAQAGGNLPEALPEALMSCYNWVEQRLR